MKGDFNPEEFETRQEFAVSADGTRVPMFIVQRVGTPRDGNNPTLLYGYGGALRGGASGPRHTVCVRLWTLQLSWNRSPTYPYRTESVPGSEEKQKPSSIELVPPDVVNHAAAVAIS